MFFLVFENNIIYSISLLPHYYQLSYVNVGYQLC